MPRSFSRGMPERLHAVAPLQKELKAQGKESLMDDIVQSLGKGRNGGAGHCLVL